jgi:hypothetical protein
MRTRSQSIRDCTTATIPLRFTGVDADGDRVNYTKLFAVDTLPPSLLVSTGGFFDDDGVLTLNAVGDRLRLPPYREG